VQLQESFKLHLAPAQSNEILKLSQVFENLRNTNCSDGEKTGFASERINE